MFTIVICTLLLVIGVSALVFGRKIPNLPTGVDPVTDAYRYARDVSSLALGRRACKIVGVGALVISGLSLAGASYTTVPAGHAKVASLFGKVGDQPYSEGLHFPVNPLYSWSTYDLRQKTHKERAGIPSEDKLITTMEVSVQYRTISGSTPSMLQNTGNTEDVIAVHLVPKLRSILREQGKGVKEAQDFFKESIQTQLQHTLQTGLSDYLTRHGLRIDSVLIRDVTLPKVIRDAIELTKTREQQVLAQRAELERFATEQDQKVKVAESEFEAAQMEAKKIRELADANAYQIEVLNKQLARSPNYIELKRVEQWNGTLPVYAGGDNIPMIDLRSIN